MSSCPVDHSKSSDSSTECPVKQDAASESAALKLLHKIAETSNVSKTQSHTEANAMNDTSSLSKDREISSIPKLREQKSQANWVYPSEKMFYEAMKRKNHDPKLDDMRVIVPIHNAVNERAWYEILKWESFRCFDFSKKAVMTSNVCLEKPRLLKFEGDASKISPKARFFSWLGYNLPFDRHDWSVERGGEVVDYVIDFYTAAPVANKSVSFYIDARPKLNSWQGFRMRFFRAFMNIPDLDTEKS